MSRPDTREKGGPLPPAQRKTDTARDSPAEQWRPYKPGIEINGRGQLRTTDAMPKSTEIRS